jgi:hypothetical protein
VTSVELNGEPMNHETVGTTDTLSLDGRSPLWKDRPLVVFVCAFAARVIISAVFLGSCDTLTSVAHMPLAASHGYFYIPYFPVIDNILGTSALVASNLHFVPIALAPKLIPCFADSLIAVWLLMDNRFETTYRRRAAWLYAFCPLPIILVCIQGQWDSLWILPMVSALAMADLLRHATSSRRRTLVLIGALLGVAILSKPVAIVAAGLLIPNFRLRQSTKEWIRECCLVVVGLVATMGVFFAKFAFDGTNLHQDFSDVVSYGGAGFTVFGPAKYYFLQHPSAASRLFNAATVTTDLRDLAILYVLAIVLWQIFAEVPLDKMTVAAALLLISPAVGGLAPQYLLWPLVFILASGRFRAAVLYALSTSSLYFVFFLIPGASIAKGESVGAYLPLRSLSFLGIPKSALEWFANSSIAIDIWSPLTNLVVPGALCCFGIYLLVSRTKPKFASQEASLQPLELRAIRTSIPYVAAMVAATATYSLYTNHRLSSMYALVDAGVQKYGFTKIVFSGRYWSSNFYFTTQSPWRDLVPGTWWGSVLILGPILILLWGVYAGQHFANSDATVKSEYDRQSFVIRRRVRERETAPQILVEGDSL